MGRTEQRLAELGLTLPPMPKPLASHVPIVQSGSTVYLSGHIPFQEDMKSLHVGKVGVAGAFTVEQAQRFARTIALELVSTLKGVSHALALQHVPGPALFGSAFSA
jgi:enamine deaminase RidA (YjgF/YER057c/UK114 family)